MKRSVNDSVTTERSITNSIRVSVDSLRMKGKEEYLYSAILVRTHTLKALRHGSHSSTCKLHHSCLSFVSVHQIAPPLTEVADIELQLTTQLSTRRDERLSWPGWLTYSEWWWSPISYRSSAGQRKFAGERPTLYR